MILKASLIAALLLLSNASLFASDSTASPKYSFPDSTLTVRNVTIIGNEVTKGYIIEREMALRPGVLVTYADIEYDINRIYSLRLFNKVDVNVIPDSGRADLIVAVSERWYFYPYPILGIKDHTWSHLYYGIGLIHTNFEGRNVQVTGEAVGGYDPFVTLIYVNPLIDRDRNLFFRTRFVYSVMRNRSLLSKGAGPDFNERWIGGQIGIGKRLSLFSSVLFAPEFWQINVSDNRAGRTLSPDGTDRYFSLNASYTYDTRDLGEYPRIGTLIALGVSKVGLGDVVDYERYNADFRRYIPIDGETAIAMRVFGSVVGGGTVPNYGHVFFGYDERIRGHARTIVEGEEYGGGAIELHLPIISPHYMRIERIPIEQFRDIRYAVYFALFANAGIVNYRHDPIAVNRFESGYGAGFHFLLSYSAVLRVEYAFGQPGFKGGELLLDLGAAI